MLAVSTRRCHPMCVSISSHTSGSRRQHLHFLMRVLTETTSKSGACTENRHNKFCLNVKRWAWRRAALLLSVKKLAPKSHYPVLSFPCSASCFASEPGDKKHTEKTDDQELDRDASSYPRPPPASAKTWHFSVQNVKVMRISIFVHKI